MSASELARPRPGQVQSCQFGGDSSKITAAS